MTAQNVKIVLVFLFAWTLVSAGGCGSADQKIKKKNVIVPWSWWRYSTWPWFSTNIQRATKTLENERKNMEKITNDFLRTSLSGMRQYETNQSLDNTTLDKNKKRYPSAFKKYKKLHKAGMKKLDEARETCVKVIKEMENDSKLTEKEREEMKKASDTSKEAKETLKFAIEIYEEAKKIHVQVERNQDTKSAKKQGTFDEFYNELDNQMNESMYESENASLQLSDEASVYDSTNDWDENSEEDENQSVNVKRNLGPIQYQIQEDQPQTHLLNRSSYSPIMYQESLNEVTDYYTPDDHEGIRNYRISESEDNDSNNSWKFDGKKDKPLSLKSPKTKFNKTRQYKEDQNENDSSASQLRYNLQIQGNPNALTNDSDYYINYQIEKSDSHDSKRSYKKYVFDYGATKDKRMSRQELFNRENVPNNSNNSNMIESYDHKPFYLKQ